MDGPFPVDFGKDVDAVAGVGGGDKDHVSVKLFHRFCSNLLDEGIDLWRVVVRCLNRRFLQSSA